MLKKMKMTVRIVDIYTRKKSKQFLKKKMKNENQERVTSLEGNFQERSQTPHQSHTIYSKNKEA